MGKRTILIWSFVAWFMLTSLHQGYFVIKTSLEILQGNTRFKIKKKGQLIVLKPEPFSLMFTTKGSDRVYLFASIDSLEYTKAKQKRLSELKCFSSYSAFSEPSENADRELYINGKNHLGFHCLFALHEDDEFIRFNTVRITNHHKWVGTRVVEQVLFIDNFTKQSVACDSLKGQVIYLNYSAGQEDNATSVKLIFQ